MRSNETRWFDGDARRAEAELRAWTQLGFVRDEASWSKGILAVTGTYAVDGEDFSVRVEYPSGFPYRRPDFFLPDLPIQPTDRHRLLRRGQSCLRGYLPDEWDSDHRGIDLLPDLERWIRSHRSGVWDYEHRAPDLMLFPRWANTSALIDLALEAAVPDSAGRLRVDVISRHPALLYLAPLDSPSEPPLRAIERHQRGIYLRLSHAPIQLAGLMDTRGPLSTDELLQALDQEFPGTRARVEKLLPSPRPQKNPVIALQFPLEGGPAVRESWEVLLLARNGKWIPLHVNALSDSFSRSRHVVDLDRLQKSRVLVLGVGAIGSSVAMLLAQSGVGHLTLVDNDVLSVGNLSRHRGELSQVGQPKTVAIKEQISRRLPGTSVSVFPESGRIDLYDIPDSLTDLINQHDVVAVCVGNEPLQQYLNRILVDRRRAASYAWVYLDAACGRVIRVLPQDTGCYECYRSDLRDHPDIYIDQTPRIPDDLDTLPLDYGCNTPAVPGTAFDHERVAAAQARQVVQVLLRDSSTYPDDDQDHLLLLNRPDPNIPNSNFESSLAWNLRPRSDCPTCSASTPNHEPALPEDQRLVAEVAQAEESA